MKEKKEDKEEKTEEKSEEKEEKPEVKREGLTTANLNTKLDTFLGDLRTVFEKYLKDGVDLNNLMRSGNWLIGALEKEKMRPSDDRVVESIHMRDLVRELSKRPKVTRSDIAAGEKKEVEGECVLLEIKE